MLVFLAKTVSSTHSVFKVSLTQFELTFVSSSASLSSILLRTEESEKNPVNNLTVGTARKKDEKLSKSLECVFNQRDYQAEITFCIISDNTWLHHSCIAHHLTKSSNLFRHQK